MGEWMCRDPNILDLCTSWRWVVSFTPWPLDPWESAHGTHWIGGFVGPTTSPPSILIMKYKYMYFLHNHINELGKDLEETSMECFKLLSQHLSGGTEENHKKSH
jgi:hypothetical protein